LHDRGSSIDDLKVPWDPLLVNDKPGRPQKSTRYDDDNNDDGDDDNDNDDDGDNDDDNDDNSYDDD